MWCSMVILKLLIISIVLFYFRLCSRVVKVLWLGVGMFVVLLVGSGLCLIFCLFVCDVVVGVRLLVWFVKCMDCLVLFSY